MPFRKVVLSLAVLLFSSLTLAQGTYTQIDVPGAVNTYCQGIDSAGDIVGAYGDISYLNGFLLSDGVYTTINYPGATDTYADGINDRGQIVGAADYHGFLYDISSGTFTTLDYPLGDSTVAWAINNSGMISGLVGVVRRGDEVPIGFEWDGGPYRRLLPEGFAYSAAAGINNLGETVLQAYKADGSFVNLIFSHGKYQLLTIPAPQALAVGINDQHAVVGLYIPSAGVVAGFLYQNGNFQPLIFDGSGNTRAESVNASGEVVGYFYDSSNIAHGFTWTPPADAGKK